MPDLNPDLTGQHFTQGMTVPVHFDVNRTVKGVPAGNVE